MYHKMPLVLMKKISVNKVQIRIESWGSYAWQFFFIFIHPYTIPYLQIQMIFNFIFSVLMIQYLQWNKKYWKKYLGYYSEFLDNLVLLYP